MRQNGGSSGLQTGPPETRCRGTMTHCANGETSTEKGVGTCPRDTEGTGIPTSEPVLLGDFQKALEHSLPGEGQGNRSCPLPSSPWPQRDLQQGNDPTLPSLGTSTFPRCLSKPISNASFSLQTSSKLCFLSPNLPQDRECHLHGPQTPGLSWLRAGAHSVPSWSAGPRPRWGAEAAMRTQPLITSPCKASSSVIILESFQEAEHLAPGHVGRMWGSCNWKSVLCDLKTGPSVAAAERTF